MLTDLLRNVFLDIGALGVNPTLQPAVWFTLATWLTLFGQRIGLISNQGIASRGSDLSTLITVHFKHGGFLHVLNNTIANAVVFWLFFRNKGMEGWASVVAIALLGASLLWLLGTARNAAGASLLNYGLLAWVIFDRLYGVQPFNLAIIGAAALVLTPNFFHSMNPADGSGQGHLAGAVAGVVLAWADAAGHLPWSAADGW